MEVSATEVAVFTAASEKFNQANIKCSIEESINRFDPVFEAAKAHGVKVRGYVSCIAGQFRTLPFKASGRIPLLLKHSTSWHL